MIITKLISGLGNQLFQYALARQLAIQNNTSLKLDTSFYEKQSLRKYRLGKYNIQADIVTIAEVDNLLNVYKSASIYSKIYRRTEARLPKRYKRHYQEDEWWGYEPEVFKITGNVYLHGYWQHFQYYQNLDNRIFDELTLKDKMEQDNYALFKQVQQDDSSVSLHIRRGDYITDKQANNLMGILPLDYYRRAIEHIIKKVKSPSFYIFSDDLDWAKDNLQIDAPVSFADIDGGSKDYLELDLMRKCRHQIVANSSFSWWGAFLNRNPGKIVVAPTQWVKQDEINNKTYLHFPTWVKL